MQNNTHSTSKSKDKRDPRGVRSELTSDQERFWAKVEKTASCWNWTACLHPDGYGKFRLDRKNQYAHRVSYTWAAGRIEAGNQIDHACHNRSCVNPEHLRAVLPKMNQENRSGAQKNSKSGIRGVHFDKSSSRWSAFVGHNGRRINVGRFNTAEEAEVAVIAKRIELYTNNLLDWPPRT